MAPEKNQRKPTKPKAVTARENGKRGGRPKGRLNKITIEIRTLAQKHAPDAFTELVRLSCYAESEASRIAAAKEVLDRAYGKSPQPIEGAEDGPPVTVQVSWLPPSAS